MDNINVIDIDKIIDYVNKKHGRVKTNKLYFIYNVEEVFDKVIPIYPIEGRFVFEFREHYIKDENLLDMLGLEKGVGFPCINYLSSTYNCPFCLIRRYVKDIKCYTFYNYICITKVDGFFKVLKISDRSIANEIYKLTIQESEPVNIIIKSSGQIKIVNKSVYDDIDNNLVNINSIYGKDSKVLEKIFENIDDIIDYFKTIIELQAQME